MAAALAILVLGLPLWLALAAIADGWVAARARRAPRFGAARTLLFLVVLAVCELSGVAAAFVQWLAAGGGRRRDRLRRWSFALQCWWVATLARAGLRCYRVRLRIEGDDAVAPGPILLLLRHTSIADTVLAGLLVSARHRIVLRYVLKRPLLLDPCLDIVGHRLVNHFARRGGSDSAAEIEAVARLAEGLGPRDGVLIYPEGTRFSHAKRRALLARLRAAGRTEELARAAAFRHVLPPRPRGVYALLATNARAADPADVVFCAHAGFDGSVGLADLLRGDLVGAKVDVRFRRVPWREVPEDAAERESWLHDRWRELDDWVGERLDERLAERVGERATDATVPQ